MAQRSPLFSTDAEFENEVRRISRELWPSAQYDGASNQDGRERDGVFVTEEMVHVLECTVSRKRDKAEQDIKKIVKLLAQIQSGQQTRGVKGWFVTLDEPTADQRGIAERHKGTVVALSYDQFRAKLIEARKYIDLRRQYPFGSVRDPETKSRIDVKYVPLDLIQVQAAEQWDVDRLADAVDSRARVLVLGDYGAGKSTTMRELFIKLARRFVANEIRAFPILLNLREHQGQADPVEALERHARRLGYPHAAHLVRAWRSGYAIVLLDGFDELTSVGWISQTKKLRTLRYSAMELIRGFVRETPPSAGMAVSGRAYFFDSPNELLAALALDAKVAQLELGAFGEAQAEAFLRACSWEGPVPTWLPPRPLLLAYLASKRFLADIATIDAGAPASTGWNVLLNMISAREAEIEVGIEGATVRTIIERLATTSRTQIDGLAAITPEAIVEVFSHVCGYAPDDKAMGLLQRLPGLGPSPADDASRRFLDSDLADAARAGDVARFILDPFTPPPSDPSAWQCSLDRLGVEVCAVQVANVRDAPGKCHVALQQAVRSGYALLASEVLRVMTELGIDHSRASLTIHSAFVPVFSLAEDGPDLAGIEFRDCMFKLLEVEGAVDPTRLPRFVNCYFGQIDGRLGDKDLPLGFEDCMFEAFTESAATNSAILGSSLATGTKVLLTVLRKLYLQRGAGRREAALFRGLDHRDRRLVPEVLGLISASGLAVRARTGETTIWQPVRAQTARVRRLLAAPNLSTDALVAASAALH
jgi:hypothetical protein